MGRFLHGDADKVLGGQTTEISTRTTEDLPEKDAELCATKLGQEMKEAM